MGVESPRFVYFDLGKVIVNFDVDQMCRQMAAAAGVDPRRVHSALFDTDLQSRLELGQISREEFFEAFCQATGGQPDCDALARAGCEIFELNTSILPVIAQLRAAGFRLGILSNTCQGHWEHCLRHYVILRDLFSVYALSYCIGAAKPGAKMFQAAAELAGVQPQDIFYIDDTPGHIAGAKAVGFDGAQYTTTPRLVEELRRRGLRFNY
jgi:putative hydrolase of the HAD superfamily